MSLYTLSSTGSLPPINTPANLRIEESANIELLAAMGTVSVETVIKRMAQDHLAFVGYMNDTPAAFGWMARGKATIGELDHTMILPVGNRYLWNFRTMEAFRGLGIYPALLQYIIRYESLKADRFWIIHAPENNSSLKGIQKAGFEYVGDMYSNHEGAAAIGNVSLSGNARSLLEEMDIIISDNQPASCWNCSSPYLKKRQTECCCTASGKKCIGNKLPELVN